jgi:iron complex outermembrane recepter protein
MTVRRIRSCAAHQQGKFTGVKRTTALIAGLSLGVPLLATHANAQAVVATSEAPALEEVVVTARRKSELLQDVPQTVTPVTSADIQNFNLQTMSDVAQLVPGLQLSPGSNRALDTDTFRGVSFQPATGTQNTLGVYVNDTFVTNNFITTSIFDIGQIELLSGPQGTLRGEPAPSGSMTITTHKPDMQDFGGFGTFTQETYGNTNGSGAINLPIVPGKFAVRLAGLGDTNALDGVQSLNSTLKPYSRTYAGRASARFEPVDSVEANVMYQYSYWQQGQFPQVQGTGGTGGQIATVIPGVGPVVVPNPFAPAGYNGTAIAATDLHAVQNHLNVQWNHSEIITGQLDYHFAGQKLSYVGSYWTFALNGGNNSLVDSANQVPGITNANPVPRQDFQFYTPGDIEHNSTHELRIASETPIADFIDYTAGAFFRRTYNQVNNVQVATFLPGSFGSPLGAPDPFTYNPNYTLPIYIQGPVAEKETSEFASVTFHVLKDTELTLGGRHIKYEKRGYIVANLITNGVFLALPAYFPPPNGLGLPAGVPCSAAHLGSTYPNTCDVPASLAIRNTTALPYTPQNLDDNTWIYNASLSHKFFDNLLTYVTIGSSWRPPGIAVGINNAANDPTLNSLITLKSEHSTDYELGTKWTFLENRGRLNLAIFHQKYKNFIYSGLPVTYLSDNGATTAPAQFSFTSNPDAVINGVNLETGYLITRQWSVALNATYANGHLTGSEIPCNPPGGSFPPTAPPPYVYLCPSNASTSVAPNFNSALQSEYHMPMPVLNNTEGFVRGLWNYYGSNPHASQYYTAPGYGIVNFFVGLRSPNRAWEAMLFAKNAFDAQPVLLSTVGGPQLNTSNLNLPYPAGGGFGNSGYYSTMVAPRREFGITFTYAFGSR